MFPNAKEVIDYNNYWDNEEPNTNDSFAEMKGFLKKVKGATGDIDYLIHFQDYAENISTIDGVLKPYLKRIELYGGKLYKKDKVSSSVKISYEVLVFNTIEERQEYKQNQKAKL